MPRTKSIVIKLDVIPCISDAKHLDDQLAQIKNQVSEQTQKNIHISSIIFTLLWESGDAHKFIKPLQKLFLDLEVAHTDKKFLLICNSWFEPFDLHQKLSSIDKILYLDFFALLVYYKLIVLDGSPIAESWNALNKKILFLTRKPYRINRIRLLYKLLQTELKEVLNWSFIVQEKDRAACRCYLPDLSDAEFDWLMTQQRKVDVGFSHTGISRIPETGIPYPSEIYGSALFQIISETDFDRPFMHPRITEKIWLSIVNHRPFIVAGEFCTLDALESMGFCSFRNFLAIPNYDNPNQENFLHYGPLSSKKGLVVTTQQCHEWSIFYKAIKSSAWPEICDFVDMDALPSEILEEINTVYTPPIGDLNDMRLDAIVQNALFWNTNITDYQAEISEMTQHNHNQFLSLGKSNHSLLQRFLEKHQIDCDADEITEALGLT